MNTETKNAAPGAGELVAVHRGLRREARLLVTLVAATAPGDTVRARLLSNHFGDYRRSLLDCLDAQAAYLRPPLLARLDLDADLVLRSAQREDRVAATLAAAGSALPGWEAGAGEDARDGLTALLAEHRAVLLEHLAEEARALLPLAARHLSPYEWDALARHLAVSPGPALEDADRAERRALLARLPLPARLHWYAIGRARYARRMRAVRRTPRPAP
ncbi:hemerythrin domain-containing protein [Streptomyces sp. NBC_00503]|uniref:hemerythrin domain-containing protein n=1 Tax=Streptomyces sp. NBC_00503 TaxID=2903659 RepID=UPI002E8049CE|nr:hemerythrin domain-containing protein [Streptomyces sp. NBC_00503]WUD84021.1 hemerythrin domain-containing protein [Streptomyces sp. NBC_00503]